MVDSATMKVVIITLDNHLSAAVAGACASLKRDMPGLKLSLHAATDWNDDGTALERCRSDIADGDIIIASMLFMEDHIQAVLPDLIARRENCDAMIGMMSAGEVMRLTRMGAFRMDTKQRGPLALLRRLRGGNKSSNGSSGAKQLAMLKRLPKILRFIPGTAQDVRAYFVTLQYWLAGSDGNIANMVRHLAVRYAAGPRQELTQNIGFEPPIEYPEVGVYHPSFGRRLSDQLADLPVKTDAVGTVGVIVMRSYLLAGNTAQYDGVIASLEAQGLNVVTAFAAGLDARPAIDQFFVRDGIATVDAVVSLTGFSLVGGPAYNDAKAAEDALARLDVPYIAAQATEFQTLESWGTSERGLMPVETTIMVAIPELDGATVPMLYGGRSDATGKPCSGCSRGCINKGKSDAQVMHGCPERAEMLAARVAQLVALRKSERAKRRVGIVLFNFPPNAGNTGTAAFLSVFASLHNVLKGMKAQGYDVEVPETVDALRDAIIKGNAAKFGAPANVCDLISTDDHVRRERWLDQIESQWGPAPGKQLSNGQSIFVLGAQFGNIFVGVQPSPGYEGDPMRLLFEGGFAPTHAFSAFYRWLREDYGADAVLHFGTHGSLEFMPGKQTGLSADCWPDRLIGDLPNYYLYASNNPSEGMIARRRSGATLVSYMTPPLATAGLYRGLVDLKASIERWRTRQDMDQTETTRLAELIQAQGSALELCAEDPLWGGDAETQVQRLGEALLELEYTLIPDGLHVVGEPMSETARVGMLQAVSESAHGVALDTDDAALIAAALSDGDVKAATRALSGKVDAQTVAALAGTNRMLATDPEIDAVLHALDGGYIHPAPGGDLIRTPEVLPTGRNVHGFDPFRIPSAHAVKEGERQAQLLVDRHVADAGAAPRSIALVLWGTDNLKTEGASIAQALALIGARPRFDTYGRLSGADLVPLEELGRPRVDVVMTLSGIFRDLMPLQTKLLAEATFLAASADEPAEMNPIRANALAYAEATGCDLDTASLRVFSNADGAYGSNVNMMVDLGTWNDEAELGETFAGRKSFAYGRSGKPVAQAALLKSVLSGVDLAYQNVDSVELGVTTVDHYFDTLGGISSAVASARGKSVPVYIGDHTQGAGKVRTLGEQVALETRTRTLNPKWYESMLSHGYEGVRQIETHITNTMGWSATTGQVDPWVYQQMTETFVLDPEMRERLAQLNPTASVRMANRLIEAHERQYWTPDESVLAALQQAGEDLEDRLEGVGVEAAA